MIKISFPLLIIMFTFIGCDCMQTVGGVVRDGTTDQAIEGAVVVKFGDDAARDTTNSEGRFQITDVTGQHDCPYMQVTIEKTGYTTQTVSIPNDAETTVRLSN